MDNQQKDINVEKSLPIGRIAIFSTLAVVLGLTIYFIVTLSMNKHEDDPSDDPQTSEANVDNIYDNLVKIAKYELNEAFEYKESDEEIKIDRIYCLNYDSNNFILEYISMDSEQDFVVSVSLSSNQYTNAEDLLASLDKENFAVEDILSYTRLVQFGTDFIQWNDYDNLPKVQLIAGIPFLFNNITYTIDPYHPDTAYYSMTYKYRNGVIGSIIDYEYINKYTIKDIYVDEEPTEYTPDESLLYQLLDKIV